ncbi:hypothetical protein CHUAL_007329 [Chamberlinius hualienensis]
MGKRKLSSAALTTDDVGNRYKQRQTRSMPNSKRQDTSLSRKKLRQQARNLKKEKKREFFSKQKTPGKPELLKEENIKTVKVQHELKRKPSHVVNKPDKTKAEEKLKKLQADRRKKTLIQDNQLEDKHIKQLEKRLKMNKRKSKSLPKAFVDDGLDLLLDLCDPEKRKDFQEVDLDECDSDFSEDFALATGQLKQDDSEKVTDPAKKVINNVEVKMGSNADRLKDKSLVKDLEDTEEENDNETEDENYNETEDENYNETEDDGMELEDDEMELEEEIENDDEERPLHKLPNKKVTEESVKEDIYGRLIKADGSLLPQTRWVPQRQAPTEDDDVRLTKQIKGHLNRLNLSSMSSTVNAIEQLYTYYSRNSVTSTMINSVIKIVEDLALQRQLVIQEQCMLIAILHANIGPEIGAQLVENVTSKFIVFLEQGSSYGDEKKMDNILLIMVYLYIFKVIHAGLLYDILDMLIESFQEKCIELILLILKSAGFILRKDDPIRLKSAIISIQSRAQAVKNEDTDRSRINTMLDILLAIRNNNMHKIPNYDVTDIEHRRKLLKTFIRKGNSTSQLTISMSDLLNVENKGRWWIVGSSWNDKSDTKDSVNAPPASTKLPISGKIMELATKLHINTDIRKNIFSIVMTAEDYVDAFNKLLKLSLKNLQEKEAIHVAMECCLQEKAYNPYYGFLLQKFCAHDRKYLMMVQFSIWDKLKEMPSVVPYQISHLSQLISHLILTKALPLSVLKVIEYSDINKPTVRFLRQTLLKLLLHEPQREMEEIFSRVACQPKLHMFREGIRLFMRHFMLKNKTKLSSNANQNLETKIEIAEIALQDSDNTIKF